MKSRYVCMYVCVYGSDSESIHALMDLNVDHEESVCMYICMCVCMFMDLNVDHEEFEESVCMYVCVCVCEVTVRACMCSWI